MALGHLHEAALFRSRSPNRRARGPRCTYAAPGTPISKAQASGIKPGPSSRQRAGLAGLGLLVLRLRVPGTPFHTQTEYLYSPGYAPRSTGVWP